MMKEAPALNELCREIRTRFGRPASDLSPSLKDEIVRQAEELVSLDEVPIEYSTVKKSRAHQISLGQIHEILANSTSP